MTKVRTEDLGSWRRMHYSTQITPKLHGKKTLVLGWVIGIREHGGITFIDLQDKEGLVQLAFPKDAVPDSVLEKVGTLGRQFVIGALGTVKRAKKAPHGAEIIPEEIRVLADAPEAPPPQFFLRGASDLDKRLDVRVVDLRRNKIQAIFKIRSRILASAREFLFEKGYLEVNTPRIIASATEGGAALFPLLFYDKEAFLAQSPQLFKEQLVSVFEKVFEIGPVFRAEQSRTLRHLSEVTSLDLEEAFATYEDVMKVLEQLISRVVRDVAREHEMELKLLGQKLSIPKLPLKRYAYDEILRILEKEGVSISWGEDLPTIGLRALDKVLPQFYFITDWPTASKPFYIMPKPNRQEICEAFDFMYGSLEIASGGTRVSSKTMLIKRLEDQGLDPKNFEYHLKTYDFGMPPHAGWGLGVDRLTMVLTGQDNIREVVLFPRDRFRLTP